jgi:hypothetical protein
MYTEFKFSVIAVSPTNKDLKVEFSQVRAWLATHQVDKVIEEQKKAAVYDMFYELHELYPDSSNWEITDTAIKFQYGDNPTEILYNRENQYETVRDFYQKVKGGINGNNV